MANIPPMVPVPVGEAASIAQRCEKSVVVIVAYDPRHERTVITTYGVEASDKLKAVYLGDRIEATMGLDRVRRETTEDFRQDLDAALYREALEIFTLIRNRQGCTEPQLQQIERWLRAAGQGVRQA